MDRRILVLEDDPKFRTLVRCTLSDRGFEVLEVTRLDRAKQVFQERAFDLLIVDGLLPDGSGVDFIKWVRSEGYAGRIFFVSHFWQEWQIFRSLTEDWLVTRVLSKPITAAQLLVEVESAFLREAPALLDKTSRLETAGEQTQQPDPAGAQFERELARLRHGYAEQFPEALEQARAAMLAARESDGNKDRIADAHRLVHSLAGSAGSFGFKAAGELLRTVELGIEEIAVTEQTVTRNAWAPLEASLEQVRVSFDAAWSQLRSCSALSPAADEQTPPEEPRHFAATVLVVDDDPDVLVNLDLIGRQHMIRVLPARNAEQALQLARGERFDGAVLDVNLADGQSGYEVAKGLRSLPGLAELPLAFFSSDASLTSRVKAAHAGGSLFLDKSESEQEFAGAVRYLASLQRQARPTLLVLADDRPALVSFVNALEVKGLRLSVTSDATAILEKLVDTRPSALLIQANQSGVSGFDVCKMLRTTTAWKDLPILLLTDSDGRDVRAACFDAGADDYVSRPACIEELVTRIKVLMDRARFQRERVDRDGLTGLLTRRPFLEAFKARMAEAQREQKSLSLCIMDLDEFKRLNDQFGHEAGDRLLAAFGNLLTARFRAFDIRGRWGGEEFAVVLYGEGAAVAEKVLQRVLEEFRLMELESDNGQTFRASFSAGIASYPEDGGDFQSLFRAADARLYRAKQSGRDRIERRPDPQPSDVKTGPATLE